MQRVEGTATLRLAGVLEQRDFDIRAAKRALNETPTAGTRDNC